MPDYAVDTSVSVPLLLGNHSAHKVVAAWARGRALRLSGHALAETYSVLTRLPGDSRVAPRDAARLLDARFDQPIGLSPNASLAAHRTLADLGISGGATYDGLVALAAAEAGLDLVTRDARARSTYERVGVGVTLVAEFA